MVRFEDTHGRSLTREGYFAQVADLIVAIRAARAAFESGPAAPGEWHAFGKALRSGIRAGATPSRLIEETKSWASGWWRRADFANQKWSEQQTKPFGGRRSVPPNRGVG
jgi:hypothetical protein